MKKFTKLLIAVLSLALLIGGVIGISASAAETEQKWIVSSNVAYTDDIRPYFAISTAYALDASKLNVTVGGEAAYISEKNVDIYGDSSVYAHVVVGKGVAAKDMADEFEVVVKYDGETVQTITYSIAQYFYDRLYKNDIASAISGDDLLRKELYLATLAYGSAAQKHFSASDELLLDNLIYVWGDVKTQLIDKTNATVELDDNYYNVQFYDFNGAKGTTYVANAAGSYSISDSVNITLCDLGDTWKGPEGALDFDDIEPKNLASFDGISGGTISKVAYTVQTNAAASTSIETIGDSNYLRLDKYQGAASSSQSWVDFHRVTSENEKELTGSAAVFEARIRADFTGSSERLIELRFYAGRSNTHLHATKRIYIYCTASGSILLGHDGQSEDCAKTFVNEGDWFTLRAVYEADGTATFYVLNDTGNTVTLGEGEEAVEYANGEFIPYYSNTYSAIDVSTIDCFTMMTNSKTQLTLDIDYAYFTNTVVGEIETTTSGVENTTFPEATIFPISEN